MTSSLLHFQNDQGLSLGKKLKVEKEEEKNKEGMNGGKERGKEEKRNSGGVGKGKRGRRLYLYSLHFSSHKEFCRPLEYNHLQL